MDQFEKIIIGNVESDIRGYEVAVELCKKNYNRVLDTNSYISAVFNNLGYKERPKGFQWIDDLIPIEEVEKDYPLKFKYTIPGIYLNSYGSTSLYNLLNIIKFWCKGKMYSGIILDTNFTYNKDPITKEEIIWAKQNHFDIRKPAIVSDRSIQWLGSDILTARKHNLNPNINEEYYENHIKDFDTLSKIVKIYDPFVLFMMAVIEPDSVMSLLRKIEIDTIKSIKRNKSEGYTMVITPEMAKEDYEDTFNLYYNDKILEIYLEHGTEGIANLAKSVNVTKNVSRTLAQNLYSGYTIPTTALDAMNENNQFIDRFSLLDLDQKRRFVADINMNDKDKNIISIVSKYVDTSSLIRMLKKKAISDPNIYIDTIKILYILVSQVHIYIPQYISGITDKLIVSKNLFIDKNNFGLFNKTFNNFIFIDEEFNICMCDIDKICRFIKDKYNKDVRLVPKEDMGNKKLEKEIPDLNLEYITIMNKDMKTYTPIYTDIFTIDKIEEEEKYGLEGLIVDG